VSYDHENSLATDMWSKGYRWNPLTDDGDALRLAVQLDLHVHPSGDEVWVSNPATSLAEDVVFETYRGDPYAATRRAIVRAAAEIGRNT